MGIFGNKKDDTQPLLSDAEIYGDEPANYNQVLEYLAGLSAEDYKKVIKCAEITRKSWADQCKVLGIENEPTTFINPPEPPTVADSTFTDDDGKINLLDDDTELGNFLEDEPPAKVKINKTEKPKK